jgi:hypothetical protein
MRFDFLKSFSLNRLDPPTRPANPPTRWPAKPPWPTVSLSSLSVGPRVSSHILPPDIVWKTCTRERWEPDRPLKGWLLIRIFETLSDMSDNLLIAPTYRNACLLLWWWFKMVNWWWWWYYYDVFTLQLCLFAGMFKLQDAPLFLYNEYD